MDQSREQQWLIEAFITPWALPNEKILTFAKWKPEIEVSQIKVSLESKVAVPRILNVDISVFSGVPMPVVGGFTISKEQIQVAGFAGFEAYYNALPESEKKVKFSLEFSFADGHNANVELETEIIRPIIKPDSPTLDFVLTKESPMPNGLRITLINSGKGEILEDSLVAFTDKIEGRGLQITFENVEKPYEIGERLFVKTNKRVMTRAVVNGKGYGMIRMGFDYMDRIGNHYRTPILDISLTIEEKRTIELPIANQMEGGEPLLVLQPPAMTL